MWPLTASTPKQLLPLSDGYLILDLIVDGLLDVDLEEIMISVNARFSADFRKWAESRGLGLRIIEEGATREEEKPGAVAALASIAESQPRDDYLVVAGDNISSIDYSDLIDHMRARGSSIVAIYDVGSPELAKRYGVVSVGPDWRILSLVEKPENPPSTLVSTAIYAMPWEALGRVRGVSEPRRAARRPGTLHILAGVPRACIRVQVQRVLVRRRQPRRVRARQGAIREGAHKKAAPHIPRSPSPRGAVGDPAPTNVY
jgi:dTDP-glucose pyrophosphorylase